MRYIYDYYSDIGGRKENEDNVLVRTYGNNVVAVVADGLGGQGGGKKASDIICRDLIQCGCDGAFPNEKTVEHAFDQANSHLIRCQKNEFHMKSTVVYLCIQGSYAIWAHVGDSRLYHLYQGKICDYTLDHSVSQLSVLMGSIKREDIPSDRGRSTLLRAMGTQDLWTDVHHTIDLEPGYHGFLLCTDGLWEYLTDTEIESVFSENDSASKCLSAFRVIKEKKSYPECDNHSAVVIQLQV